MTRAILRLLSVSLALIAWETRASAQHFDYAKYYPGVDWVAMACDAHGDLVAVGNFKESISIGSKSYASNALGDPLIVKFDPQGNVLWSYSSGGQAQESLYDLAFDSIGNIYVAGNYTFTYLDLFPGFAGVGLPKVPRNIFVAKFTEDGAFQWLRCPSDSSKGGKLEISPDGTSFITGSFNNSLQVGTQKIVSTEPGEFSFLCRIGASGNVEMLKQISKKETVGIVNIKLDRKQQLIVGANIYKSTWHVAGHTFVSVDSTDIAFAKLDRDGNYLGGWQFGAAGNQSLADFGLDAAGNIYSRCTFSGNFALGDTALQAAYYSDHLLFKTSSIGAVQWVKQIGTAGIVTSSSGGLDGTLQFGIQFSQPITFEGRLVIPSSQDLLMCSYSLDGRLKWVMQANDPNGLFSRAFASDQLGNTYISGFFNLTATFGPFVLQQSGSPSTPKEFLVKVNEPSIVTSSPQERAFCPGDPILIEFSTSGYAGGELIALLSDAEGDFINAIRIGKYSGAADSTIIGLIPWQTPGGDGYRVKVIGTGVTTAIDGGPYFTIHQRPDLKIQARKSFDFCEGETAALLASGGVSYRWSTGDTTASVEIGKQGWHYVTAENEFGCETRDSIKLTSHPYPVATITASGPTSFCQGGQVTLMGKGGTSYVWSTGEKTSSITVKQSGDYSVIAKGEGDCTDESEKISVVVYPAPDKPVITSRDDTLYSSSPHGNEWYLAGGSRVDTTQQFKPTKSGKYYVRVTDSNGCTAQSDFFDVEVQQSHVARASFQRFEISPNPASDLLWIDLTSDAPVEIEVLDLLGKSLYQSQHTTAETELSIAITSWPSGSYYVRATTEGVTETRRFIKR